MSSKPLKELKPKDKGKIVRVGGKGSIHRRLLDMGLVTGAEVEVERVAPLGDPVEIRIKSYDLALRKGEAANIQLEIIEGALSRASAGETVTIMAVKAGWGLQRRLTDMGLTPGVQVKVVSSGRPGPVVLDVRGSRLALGYGVARKIMVTAGGNQGE